MSKHRAAQSIIDFRKALSLRRGVTNQQEQNALALNEHRAYAKSRVRENPLYGLIEQAALVPGYTLAKALRLVSGRSDPSLAEIGAGYAGIAQGTEENIGDALNWFTGSPSPVARPSTTPTMSSQMSASEIRQMVLRSKARPPEGGAP